MASQEDIVDQQTQLATYRGNLKILLRQASKFGGEEDAPLHIINGIRDTRENIRRIKQNLHGWDVKVDDLPDETPPALANAVAGSSTAPYPAGPGSVAHVNQKSEQPYKYDVFISYSHEDEDWVENVLLKTLEDAGLRVCIDFRDFVAGKPSITNMQDAAIGSRHTVLVLTPAWLKSEWALFETLIIRTKDPAGQQRRTIPLLVKPCEQDTIPEFIAVLEWIDFTRPSRLEIAWRRLLSALSASPA